MPPLTITREVAGATLTIACDDPTNPTALNASLDALDRAVTHVKARYGKSSAPTPGATLNAHGRAALDILIANPDAKCADIIGQIPGGARTLRWLDKHGYTSFDTRTQLHTVLRTE